MFVTFHSTRAISLIFLFCSVRDFSVWRLEQDGKLLHSVQLYNVQTTTGSPDDPRRHRAQYSQWNRSGPWVSTASTKRHLWCSCCFDLKWEWTVRNVSIFFSVRKTRPLWQRSRFLPSRMDYNSKERDVMGDMSRYHA